VGDRGPAVVKIQQALIDAGFPLPRFGADGDFGNETASVVMNYQRANGLTADGIIGPTTMKSLDSKIRSKASEQVISKSTVRQAFEFAVQHQDWENAFLNLNGLNMYEMLRSLDALDLATSKTLWSNRYTYANKINLPRIEYARNVVLNRVLPDPVGDLLETGQVKAAADFIAEKLAPVAKEVNRNPLDSISLILRECNFYAISDKSHISYVLASAHHESLIGILMTEDADGTAYEGRADLCNTQPGDGPKYKGRGFVQITGRCNYTLYTDILLKTRTDLWVTRAEVDLINNPEQAVQPTIAAMILAHGMRNGLFTGRSLSYYGVDPYYNFVGARAIVNDQDEADKIAKIARRYRNAMNP
jgi:hypothetical protein